MLILLIFAFLAGLVTILSPCILPILPVVLSGSVGGGKQRPLGIVAGFIASFTFFTLALTSIVKATGLSADALRGVAVVVIAMMGVFLILPQAQAWVEKVFSKLSNLTPRVTQQPGFIGGLLIGVSLGLIWAPCVGPILAAVITLALTSSVSLAAVFITLAYALGSGIPMLVIMVTGRRLFERFPNLLARTASIQRIFGVVMLITAAAIYFNIDRRFQTFILEKFPQYGAGLTALEDNELVRNQLDRLSPGNQRAAQTTGKLLSPGRKAPEITGGQNWLNSQPLSLAELKGKVVLVDFWTYSCINCIRTLPYLRDWQEKYADKGLVIVGVHAPEFEFEKNVANVTQAIEDFGIKYPVVQDNEFVIWRAYQNQYWPAKYLIDMNGDVRYVHFGEGAYQETEKHIQTLLTEAGQDVSDATPMTETAVPVSRQQTPEIYLGYERGGFDMANLDQRRSDQIVNYQLVDPASDEWALGGQWRVTEQHAVSSSSVSQLVLNFTAKEVYLVMGADQPTQVKVEVDGQVQYLGADVSTDGTVTVGPDKLYKLVAAPEILQNGQLRLTVPSGVKMFAFTFGS
jgi:cytochrome c biogenesis protein CcdA/thiol-disulfide isomerase/thioredoxin